MEISAKRISLLNGVDVTQKRDISISNLIHIPAVPLTMGKHNFSIIVETDKKTKRFSIQNLT